MIRVILPLVCLILTSYFILKSKGTKFEKVVKCGCACVVSYMIFVGLGFYFLTDLNSKIPVFSENSEVYFYCSEDKSSGYMNHYDFNENFSNIKIKDSLSSYWLFRPVDHSKYFYDKDIFAINTMTSKGRINLVIDETNKIYINDHAYQIVERNLYKELKEVGGTLK